MAGFLPQKKKAVRGRFLLWSFIFLVFGFALIGASYFVLYSDFLKVDSFVVEAPDLISDKNLQGLLSAEVIKKSGYLALLGADNILFWALHGEPAFLASLPFLKDVKIEANLTKKEVRIEAKERQFYGIWCVSGDCYAFDAEGIVFARVPSAKGSLILKIDDSNSRPVVLGEVFLGRADWAANVVKTIDVMKNHNLNPQAVIINDLKLEEWEAMAAEGPKFLFSLNFVPENLDGILKNLENRFEFGSVDYFDFRIENRIYYK